MYLELQSFCMVNFEMRVTVAFCGSNTQMEVVYEI